ncbi:MAG: protein kinase [Myxococcota bacterium]|nr:protein kinase [Myxococcota bacterium]
MKPGQKILERYILGEKLSSGSQATVYLAEDERTASKVVAKIFPPSRLDEHEQKRLQREIQILSQLEHPHIIRYLDSGVIEDSIDVLILEYGKGKPLDQLLKTHCFLLSDVLMLGKQLAHALFTAHHLGIVHRDIKPSNVLVQFDQNGCLKSSSLLDFGVAKSETNETNLTVSGAVLGTPCYMPPEQAMSASEVSELADVYSLAVVLFEMTVGRLPWKSSDDLVRLAMMMTETAIPLESMAKGIPSIFAELIANCLSREPSRRPQSMATLIQCLDKVEQQIPRDLLQICFDERADHLIVPQTESTELVENLGAPVARITESAAEPTFAATLFELGLADWSKQTSSGVVHVAKREKESSQQTEAVLVPFTQTSIDEALSARVDYDRNEALIVKMMQSINRNIYDSSSSKALNIQLVNGAAGIGKTALISQLAETYKRAQFPAHIVNITAYDWAELRPFGLCKDIIKRLLGNIEVRDFRLFRKRIHKRFFEADKSVIHSQEDESQATQIVAKDDIEATKSQRRSVAQLSSAIAKILWNDLSVQQEQLALSSDEIAVVNSGFYASLLYQINTFGLLLVVDNAQFVDVESLKILRKLAKINAESVGVCVLACSSNVEALSSLLRLDAEHCFPVKNLDSKDVNRFLDATSFTGKASLKKQIERSSKGSPLFLSQLTIIAEENLFDSQKDADRRWALPTTVGEAVTWRARRLSITVADVMCAAAIMGEVFWAEGISQCLKIERKELFSALRTLVGKGMIVADDISMISGFHQFRFTHSVFQTITLALYAQSERRYLHKRISKLLSRVDNVDPFYVVSQVTRAGRMDIAAYLYARCANIALDHNLLPRAQELIDLGWSKLPDKTKPSFSSQALQQAQKRLEG